MGGVLLESESTFRWLISGDPQEDVVSAAMVRCRPVCEALNRRLIDCTWDNDWPELIAVTGLRTALANPSEELAVLTASVTKGDGGPLPRSKSEEYASTAADGMVRGS